MSATTAMKALATRVRAIRQHHRMSQKELASLIGCSATTISNLEQEKLTGISLAHLIALADYFNVPIDWLLGRKNQQMAEHVTHRRSLAPRR